MSPGEKMNLTLGEQIKLWRKRRKVTQEELAELSGVSRNYISIIEIGKFINPTLGQLEKIAIALDLELKVSFNPEEVKDG